MHIADDALIIICEKHSIVNRMHFTTTETKVTVYYNHLCFSGLTEPEASPGWEQTCPISLAESECVSS